MRVFADLEELAAAKGEHLGHSDWLTVTQERVNTFAEATGDHQWIHVDPERATAGPFGGTIAHGYLTVSLIPVLAQKIYRVDRVAMGINYGSERVRFPATIRVGARIRAGVELVDVADAKQGKRFTMRVTVEIEGGGKPACVADTIVLLIPEATS